jgi:hypothetical protein
MELTGSLESFFRDEVDLACKQEGVPTGSPTQPYLVHLLAAYAAQPIEDRPLGLKLLNAMGASPRERRTHLREIGDTSLFVCGFWGDSLNRSLVDVGYYTDLGEMAYRELAHSAPVPAPDGVRVRGVFGELAHNFSRFVGVLMTISRRTARGRSPADVVRLYERWLRTKSSWAARRLAEEGVLPARLPLGTVH